MKSIETIENTGFKNKMYIEKNEVAETPENTGFKISMYIEIKNNYVHRNSGASIFNCFFYLKINMNIHKYSLKSKINNV